MMRTTRVKVRDCRDRSVTKVVGRVVLAGDPLETPLSGRACAAWTAHALIRVGPVWKTAARQLGAADFFVEDDTGRVLVRVTGTARVILSQNDEFSSSSRVESFVEHHVRVWDRWLQPRCTEGFLAPGAPVAVLGLATLEPDPDPSTATTYRDRATRLVLVASAKSPLVISNEDRVTG